MPPSVEARETLRHIAEGVIEFAGFDIAAISVVSDGWLHTAAVAGDESAAEALMDLRTPVDIVLEELTRAEVWGRLRLVPSERRLGLTEPYAWFPDMVAGPGPDAWHPEDLLVGLLCDEAGELRGVLSVDVPRSGLRPDADQRRILNAYVALAERTLVGSLEQARLRRDVEEQRARAEYRRDVANAMAHDLQNPLAVVSGHLELLGESDLTDRQRHSVEAIDRSVDRMDGLVGDLLTLARLEGEAEAGRESTAIGPLVRAVVEGYADAAAIAQVDLDGSRLPDGLLVRARAADLTTLYQNLVSNAVKYTEPGGVVRVRAEALDDAGGRWVRVRIEDTGLGMDEEDRQRLFEDFYRSTRREIRERSGTGLGLAIVSRLVRRYDGRVDVSSAVGSGTVVHVDLPREDPPAGSG